MREDKRIIKTGTHVIVSNGSYFDYDFSEVYIALKDFNYIEQGKKYFFDYLNQNKEKVLEDGRYSILRSDFENWLIRKGFLGLCENGEIHIGSYGDFFDDEIWFEEWKKERGV